MAEEKTEAELDRELMLELRRAYLYAVQAIERRYDLTPTRKKPLNSRQAEPKT